FCSFWLPSNFRRLNCSRPRRPAEPHGCSRAWRLSYCSAQPRRRPTRATEAGRELTSAELVLSTIHGEIQSQAGRRPQVQYERGPGGGRLALAAGLPAEVAEAASFEAESAASSSAGGPPHQQQLQSSDPLNLRWVAAESQRRELRRLSPMPVTARSAPRCCRPLTRAQPARLLWNAHARGINSSQQTFNDTSRVDPRELVVVINDDSGSHRFKRPAARNFGSSGGRSGGFFQPIYATIEPITTAGRPAGTAGSPTGIWPRCAGYRLQRCILSLKIAETLGVKSLTGVDIDATWCSGTAEPEAAGAWSRGSKERTGFPYNVFFQAGNYVLDSEEQLAKLRPDGKLILEPQPFQSYKKKLLCPEHKRNYANIEMRPEKFSRILGTRGRLRS
uniref:RNA methyltransferase n=1 Tax=Macrostomum lignano TaxID=282301 RepID=A0A1I8F473_9PLAT